MIRKFEKRDLEQITVQEEQEAEAAKFAIPSTAETFETGGVAVVCLITSRTFKMSSGPRKKSWQELA